MGTRQEYKTYTRGVRIQDTNISFGKGMSFTNAPLEEGFSRLLINYDFGEDGNTLVPRKGFQTTSEGLFDYPAGTDTLEYKEDNTFLKRSDMSIVAGNRITHGSRDYYQVIVGQITNYNKDIELYTGNLFLERLF